MMPDDVYNARKNENFDKFFDKLLQITNQDYWRLPKITFYDDVSSSYVLKSRINTFNPFFFCCPLCRLFDCLFSTFCIPRVVRSLTWEVIKLIKKCSSMFTFPLFFLLFTLTFYFLHFLVAAPPHTRQTDKSTHPDRHIHSIYLTVKRTHLADHKDGSRSARRMSLV